MYKRFFKETEDNKEKWIYNHSDEDYGYFETLTEIKNKITIGFDSDSQTYFVSKNSQEDDYKDFMDFDEALRYIKTTYNIQTMPLDEDYDRFISLSFNENEED